MSELRYGDNNTIHSTGHVDVETDKNGEVVAVWFRCMILPFKQVKVDERRANEMKTVSKGTIQPLKAVVIQQDR